MTSRPAGFSEPAPSVAAVTQVRTSAGAPIGVDVTITNTAGEARVFAVTALGVDAAWLPHPSRSRPVEAGQSIAAVLTLRPTEGTVPARYPLVIAVQALDPITDQARAATTVVEVELIVDAPGQVTVTLDPADATAVYSTRFRVLLHNSGTSAENVHLEARAPYSTSIDLPRAPVLVPPQTTVAVAGRLTVSRPSMFRRKIRHAYTVTARSSGAPRFAEGSLTARSVIGPFGTKVIAAVAVIGLWVALALIFIPRLADSVRKGHNDAAPARTTTSTAPAKPGGKKGGGTGGGNHPDGGGGPGTGGGGGSSGTGGGNGGSGGANAAGDSKVVQLNGTVTGNAPSGVTVSLAPTDFGSQDAAGATPLGIAARALPVGKLSPAALAPTALARTGDRSVTTLVDGAWFFAGVTAVGYYELTFAKPGYETQRYIIDATSALATQPIKVAMVPATGMLRGVVHRAGGGVVGAATVTISDGTNTITTSTNSRGGNIGAWSVKGLSTPSSYLVSVSAPGLGTASRLVDVTAGGSGVVDLTMYAGSATLTGRVRALVNGSMTGLGDVQVSATDGTVTRTASTVTTGSQRGTFRLPNLAVGVWVVTVRADGYQLQTHTVKVRAGRALATLPIELSPATVTVGGTVMTKDGAPLEGAGLVLSNSANTYKQTSVQGGSFTFDGVAPGTYTLAAEYFGYTTSYQSVIAVVGKPVHPARFRLDQVHVSNNSTIVGYAGNAVSSSGSLGCQKDAAGNPLIGCVVYFALTDSNGLPVPTTLTGNGSGNRAQPSAASSETGPTAYTLSIDTTDASDGLAPGRYTLTIGSPGFLPATVSVRVPLNGMAAAPQVNLFPANAIAGRIDTIGRINGDGLSTETPGANCVLAVPLGYDLKVFDPALFSCDDATKPAGGFGPSDITALSKLCTDNGTPEPAFGVIQNDGTYKIPGLCDGRYTVRVVVGNPAYDPSSVLPVDQTVSHGQTLQYSVHLQRRGVMALTVRLQDETGKIDPVANSDVTLACAPGTTMTITTDGAGTARIFGFDEGTTSCTVTATDGTGASGATGPLKVYRDQQFDATATLVAPLPPVFGRIVSTYGTSDDNPVKDVQVTVTAVTGYVGAAAQQSQITVWTNDSGCYAIVAPHVTLDAVPAECGAVGDFAPDTTKSPAHNRVAELGLTSRAVSIRVDSGTRTDALTSAAVTLVRAADSPAAVRVRATPVSTAGLKFVPDPDTTAEFSNATVSIVGATPNGAGTITVGINNKGLLVWRDSNLDAPDLAWQGTYQLLVKAPGFEPDYSATLDCGPTGPAQTLACMPSQWTIGELGQLTGVVSAPSTVPPHAIGSLSGATVIAHRCDPSGCPAVPTTPTADCSDSSGLGVTTTTGAGGRYDFAVNGVRSMTPGTYQLMVCASGMITSYLTDVVVNGGPNPDKNAQLALLGGVSGTVEGSTDLLGIDSALVVLSRCTTDTNCTLVQKTRTDGSGSYQFSGASGRYFLLPGRYLLEFSADQYQGAKVWFDLTSGDNDNPTSGAPQVLTALGRLSGTITNSKDGSGVPSATVTLVPCDADDPTTCKSNTRTTTTDGSGHYEFVDNGKKYFLSSGFWKISVSATGFAPKWDIIDVQSGDNPGSLAIDPLGALNGTVVDNVGTGADVVGAHLSAKQCTDDTCTSFVTGGTTPTTLTDAAGNYSFGTASAPNIFDLGYWQVTIQATGYETKKVIKQLESGPNTEAITLTALGTVSGVVTGDGASMQSLAGAKVIAVPCTSADPNDCATTGPTATANASGQYEFVGAGTAYVLARGYWKFTATAYGYLDHYEMKLIDSGPSTLNLTVTVRKVTQPFTVNVLGSSAYTQHADVTLTRQDGVVGTIATTRVGSTYTASDLIPTTYTVTIKGDTTALGASILPTTASVTVPLIDIDGTTKLHTDTGSGLAPDVDLYVSVIRNDVSGTVTGTDGTSTRNLSKVLVELVDMVVAANGSVSYTPSVDTTDQAMTATTGPDGTFTIGGVPHGTYYVRINHVDPTTGAEPTNGYKESVTGPITTGYGQSLPLSIAPLDAVTQAVTLTMSFDGSDTAVTSAVPSISPADGAKWGALSPTSRTFTPATDPDTAVYTFAQVPAGCWSFATGLGPAHPGSTTLTSGAGGCSSGFAVSTSRTATPADPGYTLDEHVLTVTAAITTSALNAPTPTLKLTVKDSSNQVVFGPTAVTTTTPTTIYVVPDSYTATLTTTAPAVEWTTPPPTTKNLTSASASVTLTAKEVQPAAMQVAALAADQYPVTLTYTCKDGQDVPAGCAAGITDTITSGSKTYPTLAPGTWYLEITRNPPAGPTYDKEQTVTLVAGTTTTVAAGDWTKVK